MHTIRISSFQRNSQPRAGRSTSLSSTSGTPPSSVPTGHRYSQKKGTPAPYSLRQSSGSPTTSRARTPYLRYRRGRSILSGMRSLGVGILYSSSWSSPNRHSQPQTKRPTSRPIAASQPST